jgi:uncharacterized protein with HEPN domain
VTKDPRVYLAHIVECSQKIERFTAGGRERFFRDATVEDAVLRNLEVIGDAAKRLDNAYRAAHPEIPWRALAGLRDVLIHQYEGVDLEKLVGGHGGPDDMWEQDDQGQGSDLQSRSRRSPRGRPHKKHSRGPRGPLEWCRREEEDF